MVLVVTQETYDEVVKENIEEFDMTPEEAVKEAIAQFEAQGVDLRNIIKDLALGDSHDHQVTATIYKLKQLSKDCADNDAISIELENLRNECNKDLAHRIKAAKDGGYKILVEILEQKLKVYLENKNENNTKSVVNVLNTIVALMDTQPDLLDKKGLDIMFSILDNVENDDILTLNLQWASHCSLKHERNRQLLFGRNIAQKLKPLLGTDSRKVLSEALQVIRRMTLDDDVRVHFGNAHEHSREIAHLLLGTLTSLLRENTKPPLVSELMLTIAALLVRHELCKMVSDAGIDVIFTILADNFDNSAVIQQAHKLITALAGNDDVKRELVRSGIVTVMISLLSRHVSNATSICIILKSIAALTLREPSHSVQFLENGAPEVILDCMKNHPDDAKVQKMSCWAIRNLVARCRDYNTKFIALGAEPLLKEALDRFGKDFGYDIKSALRDLDCDVKLDEQWTGKGQSLQN